MEKSSIFNQVKDECISIVAAFFSVMGRTERARLWSSKSLDHRIACFGESDRRTRRARITLSDELIRSGEAGWPEAKRLLLQANEDTFKALGNFSVDAGRIAHRLGYIAELEDEIGLAIAFYRNARAQFVATAPDWYPELADVLDRLAGVLGSRGADAEAVRLRQNACEIRTRYMRMQLPRRYGCY